MNTTPPKLHRRSYWVWMNNPADPPTEGSDEPWTPVLEAVSVEVTYADQLRGELEMGKQGINMGSAPMHAATVWVWCAMVRTGRYSDAFPAFKNRDLAELEPISRPDEAKQLEAGPVDPT